MTGQGSGDGIGQFDEAPLIEEKHESSMRLYTLLDVLERPDVKQPASSRLPARCGLLRRSCCIGRQNEIFSMVSQHVNGDWRATAAYVPIA